MAVQPVDRATLLTRIRESGLLSKDELHQVYRLADQHELGVDLSKALIDARILTKFQAKMLLGGRSQGFILGQYRILDKIGEGGMGRVFKAQHMTMNRIVAIKILSNRHTNTEKARELFRREVQAAARLVHPHIVTAFDANEAGDRTYLVMEYVDGPNLQQLVQQSGPMPIGWACEFVRQAADGLQYAADHGMVHRDIKPANLLVHWPAATSSPIVKILDFGLARLGMTSRPRQPGKPDSLPAGEASILGTPDFVSPEQAKDVHSADIRSDLYSLGCTLYYLLTGRLPFPGGTSLDKLVRHNTDEAIPVDVIRPEIPAEVSAVVAKLMAKNPAERFQTPAELGKLLAKYSTDASSTYGAGIIPTSSPAESATPSDSPWANLLDDSEAGQGTLPPNMAMTPLTSGTHRRVPKPSREPVEESGGIDRKWVLLGVLGGALVLGFLMGILLITLIR